MSIEARKEISQKFERQATIVTYVFAFFVLVAVILIGYYTLNGDFEAAFSVANMVSDLFVPLALVLILQLVIALMKLDSKINNS